MKTSSLLTKKPDIYCSSSALIPEMYFSAVGVGVKAVGVRIQSTANSLFHFGWHDIIT